jgi:hypothetical protein
MTHPIVKTVSGMVYEGDIDSAERALVSARRPGGRSRAREGHRRDAAPRRRRDPARARQLEGCRSISELITPHQFLAAVSLEKAYKDRGHDALKGMINSVVFTNEDKSDEFIEALGSSDNGLGALVDYFSDRHEEIEHFFRHGHFGLLEEGELERIVMSTADLDEGEPDDTQAGTIERLAEVRDGDWRELAWRLRCEHWDIFRWSWNCFACGCARHCAHPRSCRPSAACCPPKTTTRTTSCDATWPIATRGPLFERAWSHGMQHRPHRRCHGARNCSSKAPAPSARSPSILGTEHLQRVTSSARCAACSAC